MQVLRHIAALLCRVVTPRYRAVLVMQLSHCVVASSRHVVAKRCIASYAVVVVRPLRAVVVSPSPLLSHCLRLLRYIIVASSSPSPHYFWLVVVLVLSPTCPCCLLRCVASSPLTCCVVAALPHLSRHCHLSRRVVSPRRLTIHRRHVND